MKVLLVNGSPHEKGCTYTALNVIAEKLNENEIETEIVWLGNGAVYDCIGCGACKEKGKCVFDDDAVNLIAEKAKASDGFVFGSPVYYAHPSGRVLSALDRLFMSAGQSLAHKPAACISSARRAGTTATIDAMLKHLTINQMPVVSSTYWTMVHGSKPEDVMKDSEGLQTMRNLANNMTWILKCIKVGSENGITAPTNEKTQRTSFIR